MKNWSHSRAIMFAGALISLALAIQALLLSATWGLMKLSAPVILPIAIMATITILAISLVLSWIVAALTRREWWPRWIDPRFIVSMALLVFFAFVAWGVYSASPQQRYRQLVAVVGEHASEIEVIGFDSFLARRWLLSFRIPPEHIPAIVSRWDLTEIDPIPLGIRLRSDVTLASEDSHLIRDAPGPEGTRCFVSNESGGAGSSDWVTFVFREADRKAWFYRGYQN